LKACPTSQHADAIYREPEAPLPIDWEVPTRGCKLAINGTSSELGYLNIANARIRNFQQPAIFPEEIEIWLPGSRSEIGWLQFKGDPQKEPSKKHPSSTIQMIGTVPLTFTISILLSGRIMKS
jgi:hypothetical protein